MHQNQPKANPLGKSKGGRLIKSLGEPKTSINNYLRSLKSIDFGSLPIFAGLVVIGLVFQLANENFLSPLNLTNLMTQISAIGILSVGIILVLLIGEIDLSVGAVSGVTAAIMGVLIVTYRVPSILAIFIAILVGLFIGAIQGLMVAKIHIPSFIVTLAGLLIWQGVQFSVLGDTGTINLRDPLIRGIANALLPPWLGWIMGIAAVFLITASTLLHRRQRARAGLRLPPLSLEVSRVALISVVLLVAIALMNINRNLQAQGRPIQGVPSAVLGFVGIVILFHLLTRYTVFGRHIYTIGGNADAASRASIDVDRIRILTFSLCSGLAAIGGMVFASRLIAVNYGSGGGDVLLNAIAAAVIGGTSLYGGRGSVWSALLGSLVIGSISNGMDLLSFTSSTKYIVTGLVLLLAVVLDSISRARRQRSGRG
jgi:D-xylose transport system permease protein